MVNCTMVGFVRQAGNFLPDQQQWFDQQYTHQMLEMVIITAMRISSLVQRISQYFSSAGGTKTAMWIVYFVYWAGMAAVIPFISLYYENVNLGGAQIGQLNSIRSFITFFSSILFAFASDVTKKHKLVLRLCVIGMVIALLLYPAASTFTAFIPIVLLFSIFDAPANPIMDETSMAALQNPRDYGKLRVGGSFGWGLMVLATGYLIDRLEMGLTVIFYLQIAFLAVLFILTFIMPDAAAARAGKGEKPTLQDVWRLVRQPGILMVMALTMIWGIGQSGVSSFLFLHIRYLGGSSTLMGTAMATSLIGEIAAFSFTHQIQERLGPKRMMVISFIIQFVWFTGLALIRDPHIIPFFQLFGGASFGLMQSGSVAYVDGCAPARLGTTAQAIRGGILLGLGIGIGSVINGFIYQTSGSSVVFRSMGWLAMGGFLFGITAYSLAKRHIADRR